MTTTINVKVCKVCGARYSTPNMTAVHKRATGHDGGWKVVRETREAESRISYQPGYGPTEAS